MHLEYLREAIHLSRERMAAGEGGPFGVLVEFEGQIIGRGWNRMVATNDPTAHAEVVAIRDACTRLGRFSLAGCSIYSSCEPCPLCLAAIDWARLDGIYHAATKADAAAIGFDDLEFYLVLTRSPEARRIRMQQALRDEANEVLKAWYRKPDRIPY